MGNSFIAMSQARGSKSGGNASHNVQQSSGGGHPGSQGGHSGAGWEGGFGGPHPGMHGGHPGFYGGHHGGFDVACTLACTLDSTVRLLALKACMLAELTRPT